MTESNNAPKAVEQNASDWITALKSDAPIANVVAASNQLAAARATVIGQIEGSAANGMGAALPGGAAGKAARQAGPDALPNLHVGRGIRYGNLTWFPVFTDAPVQPRNYATATANGNVGVVENASPSVGHLQVKNDSAQPVLLFEGALLEGGWQHRALTHTVWVPAHSTTEIPVVCVEAGRWNGVSLQQLGNKSAPARVRRAIRGIKRNDAGKAEQAVADQSAVWDEVRNFANATNKQRPTESLVEMIDDLEAEKASRAIAKPQAIYGQRGVLVAVAGVPLALEVFDHPDTLVERLEGILDSYLAESLAKPFVECRSQLARDFVARVEKLGVQPTEHTGRLRNKADKYVASEAVVNESGAFLHLATLNAAHELVLAA